MWQLTGCVPVSFQSKPVKTRKQSVSLRADIDMTENKRSKRMIIINQVTVGKQFCPDRVALLRFLLPLAKSTFPWKSRRVVDVRVLPIRMHYP